MSKTFVLSDDEYESLKNDLDKIPHIPGELNWARYLGNLATDLPAERSLRDVVVHGYEDQPLHRHDQILQWEITEGNPGGALVLHVIGEDGRRVASYGTWANIIVVEQRTSDFIERAPDDPARNLVKGQSDAGSARS